MSSKEIIKSLHNIGAIRFGDFTLKSGKKSPYYIDLRVLPSYPKTLVEAAKAMEKIIRTQPDRPSCLCGVPMAGLAIANAIGIETGIPVVCARKEPVIYKDLARQLRNYIHDGKYAEQEIPTVEKVIDAIEELSGFKTHGITRYVDGDIRNGDRVGIVDDLITTAESKFEARDLVMLEAERRNIEVQVIGVYVLLDREQGGKEALEKEGLKLYSLTTMSKAAEWLRELGAVSSEEYSTIMGYIASERKG